MGEDDRMKGERALLRTGEFLVACAARRLPARVRDERYREWAAELPAILRDPSLGPPGRRAARMLGYALDTIRVAALRPVQDRHRGAHRGRDPRAPVKTARRLLFLPAALAALLAFLSLLLIYLVSMGTGLGLWPATGVTFMIVVIGFLAGRFLPRWAFAVGTALLGSWLIYFVAASLAGWPAGPPVLAPIGGWGFGLLAAFYLRDLTVSAIRRRRLHTHQN
jgi:hypothetical protein